MEGPRGIIKWKSERNTVGLDFLTIKITCKGTLERWVEKITSTSFIMFWGRLSLSCHYCRRCLSVNVTYYNNNNWNRLRVLWVVRCSHRAFRTMTSLETHLRASEDRVDRNNFEKWTNVFIHYNTNIIVNYTMYRYNMLYIILITIRIKYISGNFIYIGTLVRLWWCFFTLKSRLRAI